MLEVQNLQISYFRGDERLTAVRGIDLTIPTGRAVALVGESGSGKSTVALGVMRLLKPPIGTIDTGTVCLDGVDLLGLDEASMRRVLHNDIGYIPQDPTAALDPLCTIGRHVNETLSSAVSRPNRRGAVVKLLEGLGVVAADTRLGSYPHEFSGGMNQRVAIATALAREPKLIIADEPTTALDVTTQLAILRLIDRRRRERGMSLLFVTHDLSVARSLCQEVAVMYAGTIVEQGPIATVMERPSHPYTRALIEAIPRLSEPRSRLRAIPGQPPSISDLSTGCRFAPRCAMATSKCLQESPPLERQDSISVACWHSRVVARG